MPDPAKRCAYPQDNVLRVGVKRAYHRDAPCFDNGINEGNHKSIPYSVWDNFVGDVGLTTLFTDAEGVEIMVWDGAYLLTAADGAKVSLALSKFRDKHPDAKPRYDFTLNDAHLARLTWLDWWFKHTLSTCNVPTFHIR